MTRREFVWTAGAARGANAVSDGPVVVPVLRILDSRAGKSLHLGEFSSRIWPEAVGDFDRCGVRLHVVEGKGEVKRAPGGGPVFDGLRRGMVNVVLTELVPEHWDEGRALAGVATIHHGYHLCVIALRNAHGHKIPFFSVNTCVHELLHLFFQDIYVRRPKWYQAAGREARIDAYATRLWLFGEGGEIQKEARAYIKRLGQFGGERTV